MHFRSETLVFASRALFKSTHLHANGSFCQHRGCQWLSCDAVYTLLHVHSTDCGKGTSATVSCGRHSCFPPHLRVWAFLASDSTPRYISRTNTVVHHVARRSTEARTTKRVITGCIEAFVRFKPTYGCLVARPKQPVSQSRLPQSPQACFCISAEWS